MTSQSIQLTAGPITQATIFRENENVAEIERSFTVSLAEGFNQIRVDNLPIQLDGSSLRVSGRGSAILHDVTVKEEWNQEVVLPERVQILKKASDEKEEIKNQLEDKKSIIEKQIASLDNLITDVVSGLKSKQDFVFDSKTVENLSTLNNYYKQQVAELKKEARVLNEQITKANEEYSRANQDYYNTGYGHVRSVSHALIVIEGTEASDVDLVIKYRVRNVTWRPFYDLRVTTGDEPQLNITYSAKIEQSSGEEWENVPLILSTASPQAGGQLPTIGALNVGIYVKPEEHVEAYTMCYDAAPAMGRAMMKAGGMSLGRSVAAVRQGTIATEFVIARPATIQDRTPDYKVTIGVIDLTPKLVYATVPSKQAVAFLVASAINKSEYPLISGEASVFLDGTYISKITIDDVVVNQKLVASLTTDPAIKVTYKPEKKYQEQIGDVTKVNSVSTEKTIILANHHDKPVLVTIYEHVPISTDQRISVNLKTPENVGEQSESDEDVKEGAILNRDHVLEYTVEVPNGEEKTYTVKYTIEHPTTEKLTFDEKF